MTVPIQAQRICREHQWIHGLWKLSRGITTASHAWCAVSALAHELHIWTKYYMCAKRVHRQIDSFNWWIDIWYFLLFVVVVRSLLSCCRFRCCRCGFVLFSFVVLLSFLFYSSPFVVVVVIVVVVVVVVVVVDIVWFCQVFMFMGSPCVSGGGGVNRCATS